jgi:hypothetical protein
MQNKNTWEQYTDVMLADISLKQTENRNIAIFPSKIHWNGGCLWRSKYSCSLSMLGFDVLYGILY